MLKDFIKSFPTATILYLLLVFFTPLQFDWLWLIFAVIIDLLDDFFSNI
ncbi:MAG: hypothetical protein QMD85_01105 [Candidatus Aenigmarchaeota archaeon]|nr:hypothetical protein [Candidatus Aenigmarchaeota archaeon]MDI6722136.1 hypothetical protein [Candidatus Aenigmarchaeota archaeon]